MQKEKTIRECEYSVLKELRKELIEANSNYIKVLKLD
jgi:hypothetical protein